MCGSPTTQGYIFNNKELIEKEIKKLDITDDEKNDLVHCLDFPNDLTTELHCKNVLSQKLKDLINENIIDLKYDQNYQWLTDTIVMHKNGKVIPTKTYDSWSGEYSDDNGITYWCTGGEYSMLEKTNTFPKLTHTKFPWDGVVVHKCCHDLLKETYQIDNILKKDFVLTFDYGVAKHYHNQEIAWNEIFEDNNKFILENPNINKQNKDRIVKSIDSLMVNFILPRV